jgi:hypothetical protein
VLFVCDVYVWVLFSCACYLFVVCCLLFVSLRDYILQQTTTQHVHKFGVLRTQSYSSTFPLTESVSVMRAKAKLKQIVSDYDFFPQV